MNRWATIAISALSDFIIGAGGALVAAMTATGTTSLPPAATIIAAVVTGLMAAARGVQKMLAQPP